MMIPSFKYAPVVMLLHPDPALTAWLREHGYSIAQLRHLDDADTEIIALRPTLIWLDAARQPLEVVARLRAACVKADEPDLPILVAFANRGGDVQAALESGATDVIYADEPDLVRANRLNRLCAAYQAANEARSAAAHHERRWEQAFNRSPAVAIMVDANTSEIVEANAAAARFYGYSLERLRTMRLRDLEGTDTLTPSSGTMRSYSHRLANGQVRDVKIFASPVDGIDRDLIMMLVFDNTKRREAETAEVRQRTLAEALSATAAVLTSTLDMNAVLDRILSQAARVLPHDAGNVMLVRDGTARMARWRGYDQRPDGISVTKARLRLDEFETFRAVMQTGQTLVIPDVNVYPRWVSIAATAWIRSYVCAPIRWGERVVGFVNLDSATPKRFSQVDADRVQALADQAAIAIRNAQLYRRIKRQAAQLELRVQERTTELDAERAQLGAILDAMAEGVAFMETPPDAAPIDYPVRYVNQALIRLTGYTQSEWQASGQRFFQTYGVDDADYRALLTETFEQARTGRIWTNSYKMRRKDGTEFDAFETLTPVLRADGTMLGAVSVIRDISREKALEEERMNFVAHASHELRTPIANLKTRLYLARKQPDKLFEHLRVIEEVTTRMQRLVDDLLAISRFQRGVIQLQRAPLALQPLVKEIVALQTPEAERRGQLLRWHEDDTPIYVSADGDRLHQVITNLVTNAINYTASGGAITVRVYPAERMGQTHGVIEVADTGMGIAPEHLPYIFQPFYRVISSVPGTGLGLSIAHQIIDLHGGTFEVDSTLGVGSTFRVWLPKDDADGA